MIPAPPPRTSSRDGLAGTVGVEAPPQPAPSSLYAPHDDIEEVCGASPMPGPCRAVWVHGARAGVPTWPMHAIENPGTTSPPGMLAASTYPTPYRAPPLPHRPPAQVLFTVDQIHRAVSELGLKVAADFHSLRPVVAPVLKVCLSPEHVVQYAVQYRTAP
jgi:hypothetical protein